VLHALSSFCALPRLLFISIMPTVFRFVALFFLVLVEYIVRGMFCYIESRIVMEVAIENLPANSRSFTLSGQGLTVTYCLEHLSAMTTVDLSNNSLRHLRSANHLQYVRELNLSNNSLSGCDGFNLMPRLEILDLRDNG